MQHEYDDIKLLPCPFCGKTELDIDGVDKKGWRGKDSLGNIISGPECLNCGATARDIESWNKRTYISYD